MSDFDTAHQVALNANGTLKDAGDIEFFHSPSSTIPLPKAGGPDRVPALRFDGLEPDSDAEEVPRQNAAPVAADSGAGPSRPKRANAGARLKALFLGDKVYVLKRTGVFFQLLTSDHALVDQPSTQARRTASRSRKEAPRREEACERSQELAYCPDRQPFHHGFLCRSPASHLRHPTSIPTLSRTLTPSKSSPLFKVSASSFLICGRHHDSKEAEGRRPGDVIPRLSSIADGEEAP